MDEDLKSRYFIYLLSQFAKKSWSLFCILVSRTKIFRLMHNETLMNIVFPGFAIDLFLMSHDHFCTPTLEHGTWLRCHWGTQIPFSWMFYDSVNTCCVLGCFVGWWEFYFFFGWFLVGGILPLMGVASSIIASYMASYKPHWTWLCFTAFKPFQ